MVGSCKCQTVPNTLAYYGVGLIYNYKKCFVESASVCIEKEELFLQLVFRNVFLSLFIPEFYLTGKDTGVNVTLAGKQGDLIVQYFINWATFESSL
jgi:hypothetical protein